MELTDTRQMTVAFELRSAMVACNHNTRHNLKVPSCHELFAYSLIFIFGVPISSTPLPRAIPLSIIATRQHS
jgi:hypothetical protein